jgi:hypothetical protein
MIEKLKTIEIEKLSNDEVVEHRKNVLNLESEEMIVEYLKYAIDTFYKTEEEGENNEKVDIFFDAEEFKPFYDVILSSEEDEE